MVKFFAINTSTGRVEGYLSEADRDEFVRRGYGCAISRCEAKRIMRSYILNFVASVASNLMRDDARIATSDSETERMYHYYENVEQLINNFAK